MEAAAAAAARVVEAAGGLAPIAAGEVHFFRELMNITAEEEELAR
jgi:hypothetical protein